MLEIKNLVKIYNGDFKAVDDVSLTIEDGEIFGFIGPNGAGKTTTIKSVVGLIEYEGGQIVMDGLDVAKNRNKIKAQIAYIPDNPEIYDNLTGIQYLNFVGDICGLEKETRLKDIEKYADMFGITKNLGDLVSSYSHGMKQKLALISAFIRHPKLLILDEPFVGLDPKASHDVKEVMKKMCEEGNSVFFSTHVLEVAEKLCNKVAIINHGKIVASGTMEEVKGSSSLEEVFLSIANNEEEQQ
ncbi:MAG: ABC transporter ATP-binding protein [Bacilli bacterium]|nr:ABC transporter ATP-binding protein [Bacilli bacterium]